MQSESLSWSAADGWQGASGRLDDAGLVLYFGSRAVVSAERVDDLRRLYAEAHIVGCSTGGQILGGDVSDDSIVAVALRFAHTPIRLATVLIEGTGTSAACGAELGRQLASPELSGVFVLSDGLAVDGTALAAGLTGAVRPGTVITGGLAGDGADFVETLVGADGPPSSRLVAAIGFYGPAIRIGFGSAGGWTAFGPQRRITRAAGNRLFELDGKSALGLYERYLGPEEVEQLPASGLLFPLQIFDPSSPDETLVRTLLAVDRETGSMTFASDIPEGWTARLMRSTHVDLTAGAGEAAANACRHPAAPAGAAVAVLVSCIGRRLVMGPRVIDEVAATAAQFPAGTPQLGFYSYGELSPHAGSGSCVLHNQTMTVTLISEAA